MNKKLILITLLPTLMFAKTVSFQDALELTIKNNKELKAKKLDIKKVEENLKETKAHKLGKLEFAENISMTNNAGHVFGMKLASREASFADFGFADFLANQGLGYGVLPIQPNDLNYPGTRTNYETKFTYEIPFFTGYKLENAKDMANLQILANKARYSHDEKQIGLEVLKAYNGAVAAKQFIEMTKKAKVITNRFVKTAQNLYDNKLTRIIDVNQAKMAQFSINTKIKEAQTKFKLAIAYLQFLADDQTITDVKQFALAKFDTNNLQKLQISAISNRDDYTWMKHNTNTMKKKIAFDSSNLYPTVGGHFEYGANDNSLIPSTSKDYYMAAVGLKYTLFDGEITNIAKQKAKIDYAKTKQYLDYMRDGINLEVKKNLLDLTTTNVTLKDKIKTKKMAEDILKETEDIYKNNLRFRTNMMYLLMSLENMLKAQADVITSSYERTLSSAKLKLSIGSSLKGNM